MGQIRDVTDLRVYKVSLSLLEPLYDVAYSVPHLKLRTQMINSGEAVPPLIAEGFSRRRNPADAARFYELAMTESDELVTHLRKAVILSRRYKSIPRDKCIELGGDYIRLSKQLNQLRQTWRNFAKKSGARYPKAENRNPKPDRIDFMKKITLRIRGMHCESCARAIQAYLSTQEGVSEASVSYEEGKAEVSFDPGKIKEEGIKKAVEEIGYTVGV